MRSGEAKTGIVDEAIACMERKLDYVCHRRSVEEDRGDVSLKRGRARCDGTIEGAGVTKMNVWYLLKSRRAKERIQITQDVV